MLARYVRNQRLADAITCGPSPRSPPARRPHLLRRPPRRRDTHHQALRALGNRLVGILHGCLTHHTPYSETIAWAHRTSPQTTQAA